MDLIFTDPIKSDAKQYHELITQKHIVQEFQNFQGQTINDTKKEIDYWVENETYLTF